MADITQNANLFTLRNNKGNQLTIDSDANPVSFRFRNRAFQNIFPVDASSLLVDNSPAHLPFTPTIKPDGLFFSYQDNSLSFSVSNDNEISISFTGSLNLACPLILTLPNPTVKAFSPQVAPDTYLIDKPAEVLMEVGMFGYDPGCPIDYLEAGLKNALDIISQDIEVKVYSTRQRVLVRQTDAGLEVCTFGSRNFQDVFVFKNRK